MVARRRSTTTAVDHDGGRPLHQPPQRLLHQGLGLRVEGRGGLVEDQQWRRLGHRLGDRHPLALPARQLQPPLTDHGPVAVGELVDEFVHVGRPADLGHELHVGLLEARDPVADVLGNGPMQEQRVLGHVGDLPAQRLLGHPGHVLPVDEDRPAVDVHEPEHQLGQRRLARARRPDEADVLTRSDPEVEALEERGILPVAEVHRAELDPPARHDQEPGVLGVADVGLGLGDGHELGTPAGGPRDRADELEGLLERAAHEGGVEEDAVDGGSCHHVGDRCANGGSGRSGGRSRW